MERNEIFNTEWRNLDICLLKKTQTLSWEEFGSGEKLPNQEESIGLLVKYQWHLLTFLLFPFIEDPYCACYNLRSTIFTFTFVSKYIYPNKIFIFLDSLLCYEIQNLTGHTPKKNQSDENRLET